MSKKDNVLFDAEREEATLIDFGLAHDSFTNLYNGPPQGKGTPGYLPPESDNSEAGDIWSAGMVFIRLLHHDDKANLKQCICRKYERTLRGREEKTKTKTQLLMSQSDSKPSQPKQAQEEKILFWEYQKQPSIPEHEREMENEKEKRKTRRTGTRR
jgi:serine/threonine protein kinase